MGSLDPPPYRKRKPEAGMVEYCKYFSTPEGCRFGDTCRFTHSFSPLFPAKEPLSSGLGGKSQACLKFFSTSGCPYGEGCHFAHYVPGGFSPAGGLNLGGGGNNANTNAKRGGGGGLSSNSALMMMPPSSSNEGFKVKLCNRFDTPEGCRYGDKCFFAHGEHELASRRSKTNGGGGMGRDSRGGGSRGGPIYPSERDAEWFGQSPMGWATTGGAGDFVDYNNNSNMNNSDNRYGLTPPPPLANSAAASFGALSTAKISVDASLAGMIIGKGGANTKNICRTSGAKLAIRDNDKDPKVKNIEIEGSFEQIKVASAMIRELLLMHADSAPPPQSGGGGGGGGGGGSHSYKTKLCDKFPLQACTFGDRCFFAHGASELRPAMPNY